MKKLKFDINIDAPREKVWQTLWGKDTYPEWTKAFSPSSNVKTDDWKEGTKVLFTDGTNNGMVSFVVKRIDNEFMSFRHDGEMVNGVEDTTSERVQKWKGSHENYTLKDENGATHLYIDMDSDGGEYEEMFSQMWPKALQKLKEIAEQN